MWNNKKNKSVFLFMSHLQTCYHFKLDFQKLYQHTRGKRLIYGPKRRKDNKL